MVIVRRTVKACILKNISHGYSSIIFVVDECLLSNDGQLFIVLFSCTISVAERKIVVKGIKKRTREFLAAFLCV
jgi:hypothetical protein